MLDWQDLRFFAAFAEAGSLSAAARGTGVEHATIARRVAALEDATGLKLVDRRGRRLSLTGDGQRLAAIAARMGEEALAIERIRGAAGFDVEVTVSMPPSYGLHVLVPRLARLALSRPGLRLRVIGETRYASLDKREADIAVRLGRPERGDLTARRIGEVVLRLYANPDYLMAVAPEEWAIIAYDEAMEEAPQQRWLKDRAAGRPIAIRASSLEMQAEFARAGCGVAMLPDVVVANEPLLVPVEPDAAPFVREVWLVVHSDMKDAPAVRAVIDALTGPEPAI